MHYTHLQMHHSCEELYCCAGILDMLGGLSEDLQVDRCLLFGGSIP